MSDGILSQDEIDALLGAVEEENAEGGDQLDVEAAAEVVRISLEAGVDGLGEILNAETSVRLADSRIGPLLGLIEREAGPHVSVEADFKGDITGTIIYLLAAPAAAGLGELMLGSGAGDAELDQSNIGAFREAMDELGAQLATALSTILAARVEVNVGEPSEFDPSETSEDVFPIDLGDEAVRCDFSVSIGAFAFDVQTFLPADSAAQLLDALADQLEDSPEEANLSPDPVAVKGRDPAPSRQVTPERISHGREGAKRKDRGDVSGVEFSDFGRGVPKGESGNLDFLLDVPLQVTVELGRTRMQIRDIIDLGKGSVIELEKLAGEPVEIYVNGKLIAKGEVVTIDENFGVKITDIISRRERVNNLQ